MPFLARKKVTTVLQTESTECGLACIAMIAAYHGLVIDLPSLRRRYSTSLRGVDLARIIDILRDLGFDARALRAELEYLPTISAPVILHWDMTHFVVLDPGGKGKKVRICDPAKGATNIELKDASSHFTGIVLEVSPSHDFSPKQVEERLTLSKLTGPIKGLVKVAAQVLSIALAVELLTLLLPYQLQITLDSVLATGDMSLEWTIASIFFAVVLFLIFLNGVRAWLVTWAGGSISNQWTTNLFSHLLKLPLDYFEKRHMGDILSRFGSLGIIEHTLTNSFVEALLDGLTAMVIIIALLAYDWRLLLLTLIGVSTYGLLRFIFFRAVMSAQEQQIVATSKMQSELMESVRGAQTIKIAYKEADRNHRFANSVTDMVTKSVAVQRIDLAFGICTNALTSIHRLGIILAGAYLCISGKLSAGMLAAYLIYAEQFFARMVALANKFVEFRMLDLHKRRVADIALQERGSTYIPRVTTDVEKFSISISGLSYRYSESDPWVIRDLNVDIQEGESFAFVGASGCGKTTLLKIILGLLEPDEGEVKIGGKKVCDISRYQAGQIFSAVMQDDQLFSGSIADNISFFDYAASFESVKEAAVAASVHDEIAAMPMGYETLVGDMGSSLSGGQKQRILMARALYRKPKIIVLDEATSHLDAMNESCANNAITAMNITRVIVAHRKETIAMADKVFDLSSRQFVTDARGIGRDAPRHLEYAITR